MMSDDEQRISEIRARAETATPGPWRPIIQDKWAPFVILRERAEGIGQSDTSILRRDEDAEFIAHAASDVPWLLDRLAASLAREARLREALEPLRAKLAPEWWREDEREWYVTCSVCDATGPRDDFWHFEDCVLGQALAAAPTTQPPAAASAEGGR